MGRAELVPGGRFPDLELPDHWTFLSDGERRYLEPLALRETTDSLHHPYLPAAFTLRPDLTIHAAYNGYWFSGDPAGLGPARVSWLWLAALDGAAEPPPGPEPLAWAVAEPADGGGPVTLVAWARGGRPSPAAARVDARVIGPGPAVLLSLTRVPAGARLPFDDPAVLEARRAVLRGPAPPVVSTLVEGDSLLAGALFGAPDPGPLPTDPFARFLPARRLRVPAGFLRPAPATAGPSVERYGSSRPWPIDRFPDQPLASSSRFSRA